MNISELQARMGNAEIEADVIEKGPAREFSKFGKTGRVANAVVQDSSGKVKLSLWNEQVDQVNVGDKVIIKNGYVGEWQGELQLSTGRNGSLQVMKGAASPIEDKKGNKKDSDINYDFEEEDIE